jgi:membrane associated rhomboid family serine protease
VIPLRDNLPTDRLPVVTIAIIAINVFVFLFLQGPSFSLSAGDNVETAPVVGYGAIPYRIEHPDRDCGLAPVSGGGDTVVCEGTSLEREAKQQGVPVKDVKEAPAYLTLFTSMFMHGGWLHIAFNMLFLWVFGNNIEDAMGRLRFAVFYLLGGIVAALTHVLLSAGSTVPTVGASGAIAAVLGAYALLYPRARVLTLIFALFVFIVEIPAMILLGLWLFLQFLPAIQQFSSPDNLGGGGIAYYAHIGGFLFGLAAIKLFANRRSRNYSGGGPRYPVY